jgi:hypothetical protein
MQTPPSTRHAIIDSRAWGCLLLAEAAVKFMKPKQWAFAFALARADEVLGNGQSPG